MKIIRYMSTVKKKLASNKLISAIAKPTYMRLQEKYFSHKSSSNLSDTSNQIVEKNIWFLGVPTHPNLGDLAQYWRIKLWLGENYPDYRVHEISEQTICYAEKQFLTLMKQRRKDDLIFFQSGYCTQDIGGKHDYVHKLVVKEIKDTPIIMLPQTILYLDKENEKQVSKIYSENSNLLILCRDFVSLEIAKRIFPYNTTIAFPDIVTTMIGRIDILPAEKRHGILVCCRNDTEKYYTDDEIKQLIKQLKVIDDVSVTDTTVNCNFREMKDEIEYRVLNMINDFMKYRVIITDRYHGTIFSLIAGTPVIVIKTNDHKVITGVDWFKGIYDESVCYIEEIGEVENVARKLVNSYNYAQPKSYFNENYYMNLKNTIENWRNNHWERKNYEV